jgi:acetylornithine deacetylase/succinyl-diaminopimelate desuccinylase-like protein
MQPSGLFFMASISGEWAGKMAVRTIADKNSDPKLIMTAQVYSIAQHYRPQSVTGLLRDDRVLRAFAFIDHSADKFTAELICICEIPAPPFREQQRAAYIAARFAELGLADVHTDSEGNVIGFYRGSQDNLPCLVIAAHLDTVFPESTDVTVRRVGSRLCAPGIADNVAGLAGMIGLIQSLNAAWIRPEATIAFVATAGEEGEGNLRGVRHLFTEGRVAGRVGSFIAFDGTGTEWITHAALGSRRYRVTLSGPGGHSWGDFGVVNPVHALGRMIAKLADYAAPAEPRTTYNVGRIEGGESVNVIPDCASLDVDLRSISETQLARLEDFLLQAVNQAVSEENALRAASGKTLKTEVQLTGHRPSGTTSPDSVIVRSAIEASQALHLRTFLNCASTDANIPISLGIPAITIGVGGMSGDCHRLSEWYEPTGREWGYKRALLLALALTGISQ